METSLTIIFVLSCIIITTASQWNIRKITHNAKTTLDVTSPDSTKSSDTTAARGGSLTMAVHPQKKAQLMHDYKAVIHKLEAIPIAINILDGGIDQLDKLLQSLDSILDSSSDSNSSSDGFSSDDSSSDSFSSDDSSSDSFSSDGSSSDGSSSDSSSSDGSSSDSTCGIEQTTYCPLGEDNTMCKYCGVDKNNCGTEMVTRGIIDDVEKATIVNKHNELRRKVAKGEETQGSTGSQPPASNMNELVRDDKVAKMAQTWTDQCSSSSHDTNRKMVDRSGGLYCGQNVHNSWSSAGPSSTKGLAGAVQAWYDEVKDFDRSAVVKFFSKCGGHTGTVGHYTQVVWGDVSKVGCGYVYRVDAEKNNWYRETVICNYCKGGNVLDIAMYITGEPGSDCPQDHPTANNGLCTAAQTK